MGTARSFSLTEPFFKEGFLDGALPLTCSELQLKVIAVCHANANTAHSNLFD